MSVFSQAGYAALENQVRNHASPYLAMHGDDPVRWQLWNPATMELAQKENKMLFVSVGYFSCYWCHVMQNESFKDKDIAKILNKHFIPVIIDRELNPAVDSYFIDFLEKYRGASGWPTNMFITPEGYPLLGSVYIQKDNFLSILMKFVEQWQLNQAGLESLARNAADNTSPTSKLTKTKLDAKSARELETRFIFQALEMGDDTAGGFGDQSKFPMVAQLNYLLDIYQRFQEIQLTNESFSKMDAQFMEFLRLTFRQMATQGLRDHLGGGFFRYTVDPAWQVPHFEKMLYDNALLALLYLRVSPLFNYNEFQVLAKETLDFMIREFSSDTGGYYSSLSSVDENGIEGAYYLWDKEKIKKLLSKEEFAVVEVAAKIQGTAELESGYLLKFDYDAAKLSEQLKMSEKEFEKYVESSKNKLLKNRKTRKLPVDTKKLAAWNSLALIALSEGARQLNEDRYKTAAKHIRDYVVKELWDGKRLLRAKDKNGNVLGEGQLEDYAYASAGMYEWALISNNEQDYKIAEQIMQQAWKRFYRNKGWHLSERSLLPASSGEPALNDGALPSPSAMLISTTLKLADKYKLDKLRTMALDAISLSYASILPSPFDFASTVQIIAQSR